MKAKFSKYGAKYDYRGAHVTLSYHGRELLGEIVDVYRRELPNAIMARVRFFCGDPWPLEPALSALNILERNG